MNKRGSRRLGLERCERSPGMSPVSLLSLDLSISKSAETKGDAGNCRDTLQRKREKEMLKYVIGAMQRRLRTSARSRCNKGDNAHYYRRVTSSGTANRGRSRHPERRDAAQSARQSRGRSRQCLSEGCFCHERDGRRDKSDSPLESFEPSRE